MKALKYLRVFVAAGMFSLVTLFFLGIAGGCGVLEKIQFVPALLGCMTVSFAIPLVAWLVITLLFGRVYCSWVCPLGILQDLLAHVLHRRKYAPQKSCTGFLAGALAVWFAVLLLGGASLAGLADPYSVFGRIASQLFLQCADHVNNFLADCFGIDGAIVLFKREVFVRGIEGFIVAACSFAALCALVAWKGRIFCNSLCPVGAILGAASVKSAMRIVIDPAKCVKCGLCSGVCKAGCLDGKSGAVDNMRCVRCFNCLNVCKKGAISFSSAKKAQGAAGKEKADGGRIAMAALAGGGLAAAVFHDFIPKFGAVKKGLPPPGASVESLRAKCTACGLCIAKCSKKVLAPAGFSEYGALGFLMPKMDYSRGFCDPNCTKCGEVCPSGAIKLLKADEKKKVKIAQAVVDEKVCLSCTEKVPCALCKRRCPHEAITLKEREIKEGGKTVKIMVPVVDKTKCTGCGACEHYCPVHAVVVG